MDINTSQHSQYKQQQAKQTTIPDTPQTLFNTNKISIRSGNQLSNAAASHDNVRTSVAASDPVTVPIQSSSCSNTNNAAIGTTSHSALTNQNSNPSNTSVSMATKADVTNIDISDSNNSYKTANSVTDHSIPSSTQPTTVLKDAHSGLFGTDNQPALTVHDKTDTNNDHSSIHKSIQNIANDSEVRQYTEQQQVKLDQINQQNQQAQRDVSNAVSHPAAARPVTVAQQKSQGMFYSAYL